MKIYVITRGEYDDYSICAVTTDWGKAENFLREYNEGWMGARIEEYTDGDDNAEVLVYTVAENGTITKEE